MLSAPTQIDRWDGQLLVSALRTHPLAIIRGVLHENPFYERPDEFLLELKAGHVMTVH